MMDYDKIQEFTDSQLYSIVNNISDFSDYVGVYENLSELLKVLKKFPNDYYYIILYQAALRNQNLLKSPDKCGSIYADTRPCKEDCLFCPLSKNHYNHTINLKTSNWEKLPERIYKFAVEINKLGTKHFKVVTTGAKSDSGIIPYIAEGIKRVKKEFKDITVCISEGILDKESLLFLKESGVDVFNNNLETSRKLFPEIVSSHTYDDKIKAIKTAKSLGYKICSGGLFGIGETISDRLELFLTLRDLGVDSSPFNIFIPFENLPLTRKLKAKNYKLPKSEIFFSIALFRIINNKTRLVLGAGRRDYLTEDEQKFALLIGASALATSGYLTKDGIVQSNILDNKLLNDYFKNRVK